MRTVLDIAWRDLRSRLRDRSAIITAFVAPLALGIILSTALGSSNDISVTIAVADEDGGAFLEGITAGVADSQASDVIELVPADDADAVRAAVDDGTVGAGLVIPAGTTEALGEGELAALRVVRRTGGLSGDLAVAVARGIASDFERGRQAVAVAIASGADPSEASMIVPVARAADPVIALQDQPIDGALTNAASYFGPAMAVFFVFFVVGAGPQGLIRQRKEGTLARLAAAPIPRSSILLGTGLSVLVLACGSIGTMWLVTTLVFGASWGAPLGVLAIGLTITIAAAAITTVVATLARTEEQVSGWTSIIVFTLALLGGSFGPLPAALEPLSLATPNGLALRGFVDLASGGGLEVVVRPLLGVTVFAAVALAIALPRANRLVQP